MKYALSAELVQTIYNYIASRPFVEVENLIAAIRKEVEENNKPASDGDSNGNA
jgi:hypothetical protein